MKAKYKNYETNGDGEGIFIWVTDFEKKQLVGTCQFTVAGCSSQKTANAKLRKYVKDNYEY